MVGSVNKCRLEQSTTTAESSLLPFLSNNQLPKTLQGKRAAVIQFHVFVFSVFYSFHALFLNLLHILTLHQVVFFPLIHFSTEVMPVSKLTLITAHHCVLPLKPRNKGAIPNLLHHMFSYPVFKDTKLRPVFHTC